MSEERPMGVYHAPHKENYIIYVEPPLFVTHPQVGGPDTVSEFVGERLFTQDDAPESFDPFRYQARVTREADSDRLLHIEFRRNEVATNEALQVLTETLGYEPQLIYIQNRIAK